MVDMKISPHDKNKALRPQPVGWASRPSGVFSAQARHSTSILFKLCNADRTRPLSVNLMQPKGPITRKMLSKGFGK
ncbi:hypothetical protein [Microcoleus vaginatus]|uniref:hypothetical protein n=1 Tax=Microcoleus vaginatus TaxID=119532 RepID=UPI001F60CB8F|nr:hypothetical protein D0A37_11045 [Microcoleus vaginatus HSN003]